MPVSAGRLLAGRYRLVERIDRGGTAEVWRARDLRLDRDVTVKILGREADPAFRERFTTEARRAAAVSHPHIVAVFDEGQDGSDAFIVMEDVRGRSLRDIVAERGALDPAEAATLIRQLAGALDATHRAGLVHLDVKPANVIVDESGNAKLTDFGIARAARDSEERELVGTARYIAPERVEGRPVTARSDVYGLALVAYELLTGRPAFAGAENEDLLRDRLERGAPHIRSVDQRLSERADAVVAKGLAREPERRYPTAGAFGLALSEAVTDPVTRVLRQVGAPSSRRWPRATDVAARSDPGLVRARNEDRWLTRTYGGGVTLLAVADGVGGEEGGDVASTAAIEGLERGFAPPSFLESARSALGAAVQAANAAVLEASRDERLLNAASTLVAIAVRGREAAIANLGDSRAYLVRGADIRQLTTDHSGNRVASITRFVGDARGVQPDIFVETLQPADRLVLCSDGLTRHVTDTEIATAAKDEPARAADALVALARSRGGLDNVTVIVFAARRPPVSRGLAGTLILALLLVIAIAGALGALLATPVPAAPSASPVPSLTHGPTGSP